MRKALGSIPSVSMFRDGACQVLSLLHVVEVAPAQHGLLKKCFLVLTAESVAGDTDEDVFQAR